MRRFTIAGALIGTALLLACEGAHAQRLEFTKGPALRGGDTLNLPDVPTRGPLVPLDVGGFLYTGYLEHWTWGEFTAAGDLTRAPGRRWVAGGPGELRNILGVYPLAGDTLVVIEAYAATRVLRDGSYVDREYLPINPGPGANRQARHKGALWLSGPDYRGIGIPLVRYPLLRDEPFYIRIPRGPTGMSVPTGHPVSWAGQLWLWVYPRGPFLRIAEASGAVLETWAPPLEREDYIETWRAFATAGPEGTMIFRIDPKGEWVVFDRDRNMLFRQQISEELFGVRLVDSTYSMTFSVEREPVVYLSGVQVYRYRIVR